MLRQSLVLALAVALLAPLAGCDSGGPTFDAAFFVGTWSLASVRDDTGDRTTDVQTVVDDLQVSFRSDGTFSFNVDYVDPETPSLSTSGTYQVTDDERLVLTAGGFAPSFDLTDEGSERVGMATLAVIMNQILAGSTLDLGLAGTVTLVIER